MLVHAFRNYYARLIAEANKSAEDDLVSGGGASERQESIDATPKPWLVAPKAETPAKPTVSPTYG